MSVPDVKTGGTRVSVLQPLVGGSGARPHEDGVDGVDVIWSFLRNVPTESVESDIPPILVTHYGLRADSGGAGRYRGGMGVEIEFETSAPYTVVTSRAMERYIFQPPGRLGGLPAATGYTRQNGERDIGKIDVLELRRGIDCASARRAVVAWATRSSGRSRWSSTMCPMASFRVPRRRLTTVWRFAPMVRLT